MSKLHDLIERMRHFLTDEELEVHTETAKIVEELHAKFDELESRVKALEEHLAPQEPPKAA